MALPCPQVLIDLIALYDSIRQKDKNSTTNRVKDGVERLIRPFTGQDSVNEKIKNIKNSVITSIVCANSFEEWFNLIFTLSEKAEEAQRLKYPKTFLNTLFASEDNEQSLLCETLHALRSYIVSKLAKDNPDGFNKMVEDKIALAEEYEAKSYSSVDKRKYMALHCQTALELAFLEKSKYITQAFQLKLLDNLTIFDRDKLLQRNINPKFVDPAVPYCLQKDFYLALYEYKFQSSTKKSFIEFEAASQITHITKQKKLYKEEEQRRQYQNQLQLEVDAAQSNNEVVLDESPQTSSLHLGFFAKPNQSVEEVTNSIETPQIKHA